MPENAPFHVGFLLFPNITQLDMTGPFEVLSRMPGAKVDVLWKHHETVRSDTGLGLVPTATFDETSKLDLVCVPGGPGVGALLEDKDTLDFLRRIAPTARYVTSVCTGSLVLGAAGLLKGKKATTHWMSHDLLAPFGAIAIQQRVVQDGNLITGGGVTAGIDFALTVVAAVAGESTARQIQLAIEYDPTPPFDSGSPASASAELVAQTRQAASARQSERGALVARAAQAL
ncbi:MAG: cyclohexyl-isocyanide hydratase [Gammaproteobacteria bacterium]|jgi:cyclohexyl-isocyanide hydratase